MTKQQIVDSVFRLVPNHSLLDFLREIALRDSAIAHEMQEKFLEGLSWDYESEITSAFDEYIEHDVYDETMHNWDAITQNCERILS